MGFLSAELIVFYHSDSALSERVKASDFDGSHKKKSPSNHERLLLRRRRQNEKNERGQGEGDVEGVHDYVFCVSAWTCGE